MHDAVTRISVLPAAGNQHLLTTFHLSKRFDKGFQEDRELLRLFDLGHLAGHV